MKHTKSHTTVKAGILDIVAVSPRALTLPAVEKIITEKYPLTRKQFKSLILDLVSEGELAYVYKFGSSYIERSFNGPVRVSRYVVLKPPGVHYQARPKDIVVEINPGASFGHGRHPTTRLAIRGIEYVLKQFKSDAAQNPPRVLDIGTGTGVLVLTAVKLGMHKGIGIDIDPCARSEAEDNVSRNGLENRIEISDRNPEALEDCFYLVTANLRFPTLKRYCSFLRKITVPRGFMVFSGLRREELPGLIEIYARKKVEMLWADTECDWAGVVFRKTNKKGRKRS
jgi:ribosomal protein L11 methyltransferase